MSLPAVTDAAYPTPQEILDQILTDIRFSFAAEGIDVNVEIGSDHWIRAKAYAARASIAIQNNRLALADISPLTAIGDALADLCSVFGVSKRPASKAAGFLVISTLANSTVTIPAGYEAIAPSGAKFATITSNTVVDGDTVEVSAESAGTASNLDADAILTWANSAVGSLKPTAVVDSGGIDGGEKEDDDEVLRRRLIRKLSRPAAGGTVSQVAQFAENSSAAIEQAFVYAAARGPGSYDVVVTKAGGDRTLTSSVVSSASAAIVAQTPGYVDLNCTTVSDQEVDVIINLSLPLPANAGGAGGGWKDAAPWPSTNDVVIPQIIHKGSNFVNVSSTSADPPVAGDRFGVWDAVNQTMLQFVSTNVGGFSGSYEIFIDLLQSDALTNVVVGAYVSAGAVNLSTYADEFAASVARLGPGEKTTNAAILPRGRRQPGPDVERPHSITSLQLSALTAEHPEILDIEYEARYEAGTTTPRTSPSVPATTSDPPRILTLASLAFRRLA